jgi:ribonuclease D
VDSYVGSSESLSQVITAFRRDPLVAVDTEAASFHKYLDRIYLVQLSTISHTAVIDPLAVADLSPVGELLADRAVEKVFHDADYDLRILDRDYRFHATCLFDTRIAAQLAGEPAIGLAALLEKYVRVKLSKVHQRADWSQRPLPRAMLAYAADDTRHLPALREALRIRLRELGRLDWAEEEFGPLEALRWTGTSNAAEGFLRIKGAGTLTGRQLAALRELYHWREELAARQDRATFRIIGNDALLAVSRTLPRTTAALEQTPGVPPVLAARHGAELIECVHRALALDEAALPHIERSARIPKDAAFDARVERLKAVRNRVATELGLDPGVLCGRGTLETVARAHPKDHAGLAQVGALRRWQTTVLGDALLAALA